METDGDEGIGLDWIGTRWRAVDGGVYGCRASGEWRVPRVDDRTICCSSTEQPKEEGVRTPESVKEPEGMVTADVMTRNTKSKKSQMQSGVCSDSAARLY